MDRFSHGGLTREGGEAPRSGRDSPLSWARRPSLSVRAAPPSPPPNSKHHLSVGAIHSEAVAPAPDGGSRSAEPVSRAGVRQVESAASPLQVSAPTSGGGPRPRSGPTPGLVEPASRSCAAAIGWHLSAAGPHPPRAEEASPLDNGYSSARRPPPFDPPRRPLPRTRRLKDDFDNGEPYMPSTASASGWGTRSATNRERGWHPEVFLG